MLLGSLSRHNDDLEPFGTLKPLARHSSLRSWTNRVIALRQISVTVLFYLEDSRRIHPWRIEESGGVCPCTWGWRGGGGERERERAYARGREREKRVYARGREKEHLAPPFICFLPPGPALCKLDSARSAVLPEVLTLILGPFFDLPLFYFRWLFPSLSFSHRHFRLLFPILPT